ncbi:hypothetical protein BCU00_004130 [Vibrio breoganii]|uniref:hypothetical protein n=1 Tax=Vibrio breoganii TaxID=553239 RepID=UPI000C83DF21|nr:hypothetical protein [Vibrio breoganii]PMK41237.1 hypothetical protein BCU00_14485 [Vibrio breoganii]
MPKNRRKSLVVEDDFFEGLSGNTIPFSVENLVLSTGKSNFHLKVFRYYNCPNLIAGGNFSSKEKYELANRDQLPRLLYNLFHPNFNATRYSHLNRIKEYIRWMDSNSYSPIDGDYFHKDLIELNMKYHELLVDNGGKKSVWAHARDALSTVLKALNRAEEAKRLPRVSGVQKEAESFKGIDLISEYRPLVKAYLRAFSLFKKHFDEGTEPDIHPLWDETAALQANPEKMHIGQIRRSFKIAQTGRGAKTENNFSRIALLLFHCFTGQNTTPIQRLTHDDMRFCTKLDGKIYLDMEKARARHLSFDTSIGFKPHVQAYIESWLEISIKMQVDKGTNFLFPWVKGDGSIVGFYDYSDPPQKQVNRLCVSLGLAEITPSVLRKTKLDALMKVTSDVLLVSMSANNSVNVIKSSYSGGNEQDHKRNLGATTEAIHCLAQGKSLDDSVNEAKYKFADVLSEYDYHKLRDRDKHCQTPIGARCADSNKGFANTISNQMEKMGIEVDEAVCTNFLGCFSCSEHRLVAAIDDIWLMLSFKDTLHQMKLYPTVNSIPTDKHIKLTNTIEAILVKFKNKSPINYKKASEKHMEAPHPLYSSAYSINDLLEAF